MSKEELSKVEYIDVSYQFHEYYLPLVDLNSLINLKELTIGCSIPNDLLNIRGVKILNLNGPTEVNNCTEDIILTLKEITSNFEFFKSIEEIKIYKESFWQPNINESAFFAALANYSSLKKVIYSYDISHFDLELLLKPTIEKVYFTGPPYPEYVFAHKLGKMNKSDYNSLSYKFNNVNISKDFESYNNTTFNEKIMLPLNGDFTIYYYDTLVLCKGSMINSRLDGDFTFYYIDGSVAERRKYKEGNKIDTWTFFDTKKDTVLILNYENNNPSIKYIKEKIYSSFSETIDQKFIKFYGKERITRVYENGASFVTSYYEAKDEKGNFIKGKCYKVTKMGSLYINIKKYFYSDDKVLHFFSESKYEYDFDNKKYKIIEYDSLGKFIKETEYKLILE